MKLLRRVVLRFVFAPLAIIAANPHLFSRPRTVSLCIVNTKLPQVSIYDPPAGPFATGMYLQLAGRQLKDGTKLHIIVFPASPESTIMPEVHRLNCSWVLQLRYSQQRDDEVFGQTYPRRTGFDNLLYTLRNGTTGETMKSGGGIVSLGEPLLTPYASFRKQILKALNQLR